MSNQAQIYVGTYGQYNNGSLHGAWIELTDKESFYEDIKKLHKKEHDPEYMFQDWEYIPDQFICESGLNDEFWDYLELLETSHLDQEIIDAGLSLDIPLESIEDAYYGTFDSNTDLAYDYIESTGMLSELPESIARYFDYESFGRDLAMDFSESDTHYFNNNY